MFSVDKMRLACQAQEQLVHQGRWIQGMLTCTVSPTVSVLHSSQGHFRFFLKGQVSGMEVGVL